MSFVTNRIGIRLNNNFQIFASRRCVKIDIHDNTENIPYFIGNIFQKFFCIRKANRVPFIIVSNVEISAVGIGVTTNLFQIFIPP